MLAAAYKFNIACHKKTIQTIENKFIGLFISTNQLKISTYVKQTVCNNMFSYSALNSIKTFKAYWTSSTKLTYVLFLIYWLFHY